MSSEGLPTVRLDAPRPGWEYAVLTISGGPFSRINVGDMNRKFNEYGDDGWELVSVAPAMRPGRDAMRLVAVFKRPKL